MKMEVWAVGKLKNRDLESSLDHYIKRVRKYQLIGLEDIVVKARSTNPVVLKKAESEKILARLSDEDYLILLDENGERLTSKKFARFIQETMMKSVNRIVFLIGGAHGFDQSVYDRSQQQISLSAMTFPHDLARLITVEQLYRAFSILHHSPYHH